MLRVHASMLAVRESSRVAQEGEKSGRWSSAVTPFWCHTAAGTLPWPGRRLAAALFCSAFVSRVGAFITAHCGAFASSYQRLLRHGAVVQSCNGHPVGQRLRIRLLQERFATKFGGQCRHQHRGEWSKRCLRTPAVHAALFVRPAAASAVACASQLTPSPQLGSYLILTIVGACIRFLRWRKKKREFSDDTAHGVSSASPTHEWSVGAASGGGVAYDGGWPQDRFASLSVVAGLTGSADAVFWGFLYRPAKYAGFSDYYSSAYTSALQKVNDGSNAVSGATWFSAFNSIALNFAQLILIDRLIGALLLAARVQAVADDDDADRGFIMKWVLRYPKVLRVIIIVGGAISVALRSGELVLSTFLSRTVRATLADLNVSSVAVLQVWGLGFGV